MPEPDLSPSLEASLDSAAAVAQRFADAGYHFYFVGGVVRDSLIGRDRVENDLDVTTEARPDRIKELVSPLAEAVWSQGERFGTIGCTIDGHVFEITTHRAERYEPGSRKPVVAFGDRLDEDLSRRDFTVNAMAVDVIERRLIDLFGGASDLRDGVLRTPLDPEISFSDDPLRMLRAARFAAGYGLVPVTELVAAIVSMSDRLDIVSAERIRDELQKTLMLPDMAVGLEMLRSTGLMARIIPELADESEAQLTLRAARVAAVTQEPAHRWAALLSDRDTARVRLRGLRASGALVSGVDLLIRIADRIDLLGDVDDAEVRRMAATCGRAGARLEEVVDWKRRVGSITSEPTDVLDTIESTLARLRLTESDLESPSAGLDGNEIGTVLDIEPGVDVGRAMAWLREIRFTEGVVPPAELRRRLRDWWKSV